MKENILIVEDEEDILEMLTYNFLKEGYTVTGVTSGEAALESARGQLPDLIILDLMLPGLDGYGVCKALKANPKTKHIPVVMLTAKSEESDIVTGLELDAEDYVTKPFSPKVLIARIRSILRRNSPLEAEHPVSHLVHGIAIDARKKEIFIDEKKLNLTPSEFSILEFLAKHPGWVFSRYQIVDAIRGQGYSVTERAVDVQILGLRRKLGEFSKLIETVRGSGYRLKESADE